MRNLHIVTIVGARPQFIKAAMLSNAIREHNRCSSSVGVRETILHTGQHYDRAMSQIFFKEMGIPKPKYNLGVGSGPHGSQTGQMLVKIEQVLLKEEPDWVLIYGDTNSTLAGALTAAKLHIPVAHVEAGLRSFNRRMPEEINRIVADHLSDMLFAPTKSAVDNLRLEGIPGNWVSLVGDIMYDASLHFSKSAEQKSRILSDLKASTKSYILVTVHRAENTDDPLKMGSVLKGLSEVAKHHRVLFPVHPRTRAVMGKTPGIEKMSASIEFIDPVGYLDMQVLEHNAALIATDSGGVQKEAYFHRVPCVTLRRETEWVELVELGWNRLVDPANADAIVRAIENSLSGKRPKWLPVYGNGNCAEKILQKLLSIAPGALRRDLSREKQVVISSEARNLLSAGKKDFSRWSK